MPRRRPSARSSRATARSSPAGGDGTINEVVNGIGNAPVALGILPMGTVNVLAMELGIPFDLVSAWKVIRAGKIRLIDEASANGHLFVQMAGIGLDAQIVQRNNRADQNRCSGRSVISSPRRRSPRKSRPGCASSARAIRTVEGSFVLVGNGRLYGGPFSLFKEADMQDGLLDVCVFRHMNYLALMRYFRGTLFGSLATFLRRRLLQGAQPARRGESPCAASKPTANWSAMRRWSFPSGAGSCGSSCRSELYATSARTGAGSSAAFGLLIAVMASGLSIRFGGACRSQTMPNFSKPSRM